MRELQQTSSLPWLATPWATPLLIAPRTPRALLKLKKKPKPKPSKGTPAGFGGFAPPADGVDPLWGPFANWLERNGGTAANAELADVGGGLRGLRATKNLKPGEVVLAVPRSLFVNEARATSGPASALWATHEVSLPTFGKLAMALMLEKRLGAASELARYIELLPTPSDFREPGPAALWTPDEVARCECEQLRADAAKRRAQLTASPLLSDGDERARRWQDARLPGAPPSDAEVEWAVACATSRSLGSPGLVPVADLANHACPHNMERGLAPDGSAYVMYAGGSVRRGEHLTISYGVLPNLVLLSQFGFSLGAANRVQMALVHVGITVAALLDPTEMALLQCPETGGPGAWQPAGPPLRAALGRLAIEGAAELGGAVSGDDAYRAMLQSSLASFSTSVEETRALLGSTSDLTARGRAALELRLEQQEQLAAELAAL